MSATAWTASIDLFSAVANAIVGASAGNEKQVGGTTFASSLSSSWKLEIFDNSVLKATFTYDELLPVVSGAVTFSNAPATYSVLALNASSTTLLAKISNVSNASLYATTTSVGTAVGKLVKFSDDLEADSTPEISGSFTLPDSIVQSGGGGPTLPDLNAAKYVIDPRVAFTSGQTSLLTSMNNSGGSSPLTLTSITEPGLLYTGDSKYRLKRVTDPIKGASYSAYERYLGAADQIPLESATVRVNLISDNASNQTINTGSEMMIAFAATRPNYDAWNLTPAYYNWYDIWQCHPYDGQAPVLRLDRTNNGGLVFLIANDSNVTGVEYPISSATPTNTWEGWCIHFKLSNVAGLGFTKVYRSVGLSSWTLVVDSTIANTKSSNINMAHHLRFGLYNPLGQQQLASAPGGGITVYEKGLYSFNLSTNPGATDLTKMLALLNAV